MSIHLHVDKQKHKEHVCTNILEEDDNSCAYGFASKSSSDDVDNQSSTRTTGTIPFPPALTESLGNVKEVLKYDKETYEVILHELWWAALKGKGAVDAIMGRVKLVNWVRKTISSPSLPPAQAPNASALSIPHPSVPKRKKSFTGISITSSKSSVANEDVELPFSLEDDKKRYYYFKMDGLDSVLVAKARFLRTVGGIVVSREEGMQSKKEKASLMVPSECKMMMILCDAGEVKNRRVD
ncbi:hypothetical protein K435DRAFT_801117 [Dendrothele bispora CBS 962.96]|uniref:Uncharacterized protein n=1 Tax=Dendrothele bispora (strain CBS 962.96) TaxID=1314807 RepID=A0A4S8LRH5_DENBC|nr:hypothetical protein K435DRAFT_801117 [Dendrothele bispora CBS 962.96]